MIASATTTAYEGDRDAQAEPVAERIAMSGMIAPTRNESADAIAGGRRIGQIVRIDMQFRIDVCGEYVVCGEL